MPETALRQAFADSFASDPVVGLDPVKAFNRATLVAADDGSGRALFDVERHRSAGGHGYTAGLPMSMFETYWMRFSFDPVTLMREGPTEVREPELTVNPERLAGEWASDYLFGFEPGGGDCWAGHETTYGLGATVCSEDEARAFGRAAADAIDVMAYFTLTLGEDVASRLSEETERVRMALRATLEIDAAEVWKHMVGGHITGI